VRFHLLVGADWTREVVTNAPVTLMESRDPWEVMATGDIRFVVAVIARNARVLVTHPSRLFELEQCYPARRALTLGEPLITPGVLGIPAWLLSGEPTLVYNAVLLATTLLAAAAMYLLVKEWTGVPGAALVAALLFAFSEIRMRDVIHFFVWDNAWTLFALVFVRRLWMAPRWRDAAGLALCCALQIGGSLYPLLVAVLLGGAALIWLVARHGWRSVPVRHLLPAALVSLGVAAVVFAPFLAARDAGALTAREIQIYLPLAWLRAGEILHPGFVLPLLMLTGVALGGLRGPDAPGRGARWLFLAGLVLCMALATGGNAGEIFLARFEGRTPPEPGFNPWSLLGRIVPGLDVVRTPASLYSGAHLSACVLAGFGVAGILRRVPRARAALLALLLLAVGLDTLRPGPLGLPSVVRWARVPVRPSDESIDFFRRLDALGNRGPIYEITSGHYPPLELARRADALMLAQFHRRPTSQCYNSFVQLVPAELAARLPEAGAIRELHDLGFTTIVLLHDQFGGWTAAATRASFDAFLAGPDGALLRKLHGDAERTAFEIEIGDTAAQGAARNPDPLEVPE
jgi:hypothetical protein